MKSKEDNADDEGLFTPPSCFLFACGAFVCDFEKEGGRGGDENVDSVVGVTNSSSQSHREFERSGGAWTKNERRRTFEMSMTSEGDEFCIISAKKTKGNRQEEARRDGDDGDDVVVRAVGFSSSMKHWASWTKGEDLEVRDEEDDKSRSPPLELLFSGWNQFGQLGDGSCQSRAPDDFQPVPLFSRMNIRVRKVACGLFHSVALCEGGSAYGFGQNPQIGAPKDVKYSTIPRLIEGGDLHDEDEIDFISCGSRHTLVATKRKVFSFGSNAKRQCGFLRDDDNTDDNTENDDDEEEKDNVYLPRLTLSIVRGSSSHIHRVRCERWSSFVLLSS
tara:strand:- start:2116 stop:3111 length:996 start_codon:yes stop_codon:yes gene_type:complete